MNKFIFVFQIQDPESFRDILGSSVAEIVQEDIIRDFKDILTGLLERYEVLSDVISPSFGQYYMLFSLKHRDLKVDMEEQFDVLTSAGKHLVRLMLQRNFGMATGSRIDFKLAIIPVSEKTLNTNIINRYIRTSLETFTTAGRPYSNISHNEFLTMIESEGIDIYLQPIVSLPDGEVVGYEALARGPSKSPVNQAAMLFGTASHFGLKERLELACISKALEYIKKLPEPYWVSINIGPHLMLSQGFYDFINSMHLRGLHSRIMFEITEHLPIPISKRLKEIVLDLQKKGVNIALDDFGCGFSDILVAKELRPKVVKLCITTISRIGRHPDIERDIRNTVEEIARLGGSVLGEGVERKEQVEILKDNGVSFVQGYYYGHPVSINKVINI
jgi:EAL domain-containing protein (putative c-di-GMP-specific phosphodiesterase class I)